MSEPKTPSPETLFLAALDVPVGERQAFIDDQCGDDDALRARVDRLLDLDAALDDLRIELRMAHEPR